MCGPLHGDIEHGAAAEEKTLILVNWFFDPACVPEATITIKALGAHMVVKQREYPSRRDSGMGRCENDTACF
jgi:hypothetical protein